MPSSMGGGAITGVGNLGSFMSAFLKSPCVYLHCNRDSKISLKIQTANAGVVRLT